MEKAIDKEIKLIIPETKSNPGVNVTGDLLQKSFCYTIIGPPGSGKSTLIVNMLTHEDLYYRKFNKVLFITPSGFEGVSLVEDDNWYKTINPVWIKTKIDELYTKSEGKNLFNMLIIFDDVIGQFKRFENDTFMTELFYNRRHIYPNINISIIIGSQKWNILPFKFRTTITGAWIFKVTKIIWLEIEKELYVANLKSLRDALPMLFRKKYDCVYINNQNELIFHNFKKFFI